MKMKLSKRFISLLLCVAMIMSCIPFAAAAETGETTEVTEEAANTLSKAVIAGTVSDPGTADTWESMMGSAADGNRYAGRVWVDKSVYTDGQTAMLNSRGESGSSFEVVLEDDEAFQVIFSVLGSSMTTTTTTSAAGPMDVVIILDNSSSMGRYTDAATKYSRLEAVTDASNELIAQILSGSQNRLAVVTYSTDATVILPLNHYEESSRVLTLSAWTKNNVMDSSGGVRVEDGDGKMTASATILGTDTLAGGTNTGFQRGTNLQSGIDAGMALLNSAENTAGRTPVVIVLTDGVADTAVTSNWYNTDAGTYKQPSDNTLTEGVALSTLLNAAYWRAMLENTYGKSPVIYGVGVDLGEDSDAEIVMDPAEAFNSNGTATAKTAYSWFTSWQNSSNSVSGTDSYRVSWTFNQLPSDSTVTKADVVANINYVDTYYPVASAELEQVFDQIYEELASGVFNPISSSSTIDGATGVDNTPLIFVDYIGQYMEIKEIEAVTLFGASYGVVNNGDGTYTVVAGTGVNPTTGENWNTSEDIRISVTTENGIQKLEIRINQEILPILMEQVISKTVGGVTSATITELIYDPLRVYYTVGIDSDILLPNGEIDVSKIQGYPYIDNASGTVSLYSNRFGVANPASAGVVTEGDAHVGFQPSAENRYYYHQANQGIFSAVTNADGSAVEWEDGLYGVQYEEGAFALTYLTYDEYTKLADDQQVYTYVSFYRPTADATDAANTAEQVTYLVYTNWGDLKESVAFYDHNAKVFINYDAEAGYVTGNVGYAPDMANVAAMISAYLADNPNADIKAMLGVGSLRTSRFHNMISEKTENLTETATLRYAPEYTHETAQQHSDNDVVVWLGNNGRLMVTIETGIALTKYVTEAIGNAEDTYALTVTIPEGVVAAPVVKDENGNDLTSAIAIFENNVLTVTVKANQTVYISGIPGGTECVIGEQIPQSADYYISEKTGAVVIPTLSQVLNGKAQYVAASVTNAPNKYGNLYITKEITSDHAVPDSILNEEFEIVVHVGTELAGEIFTIEDSAATAAYEKTVDANGNLTFNIKARQTIEILKLPAGTVVTVTETAPEGIYAVSYRTRNDSTQDSDSDNVVVIPESADAQAVVLNHYTPNSTSVELDIAGTKNFTIEGEHDGGTFYFKVQKWNGTAWEDIPGMTAEATYATNESGIKTFTIENVLEGITYTQVGSYSYQVLEVVGNVENVTYDRTLYTLTVTVTDNGGQLVATITDLHNAEITDGSYEVTFNNTYHTAPISMDINKVVVNHSGDPAVSAQGFKFRSKAVDAVGNVLNPDAPETETNAIYSDAAGHARISGVYTQPGTYYYIVYEDTSANLPGWTCSGAEYFVTVVVSKSGDGNLTAEMTIEPWNDAAKAEPAPYVTNGNEGHLTFTNTYDPEDVIVNLDGAVAKELTGKTLEAGMFTFYVFNNNEGVLRNYENAILTGTNDLDGNVQFVDFEGVLTFDKVGKYEFDIVEFIPSGAVLNTATGMYELNGMSYDPVVYDLVVEVINDPVTGKLAATYYFEDATGLVVTFHNRYEAAPTTYQLSGQKLLNGRAMQAGEFTFGLYLGDVLLEKVSNKADGTFAFAPITYTQAGVYVYSVREIEPAEKLPGVRYDGVEHPITVTVTVTDSNGVLSAAADLSNLNILFENTYVAAPVSVEFPVRKTLEGADLTEGQFRFSLYATDSSFAIPADAEAVAQVSHDAAGVGSFGTVGFHAPGTYFYTVIEETANPVDGFVYDRSQHHYIVSIRDNGNGNLEATVTYVNTGATASGDELIVAPAAQFTNATFEEVTEKSVYLAGSTLTHIDGQRVNAGDILTYFITYTNYTGEDVVVDIMDTIPKHTTYVDGSASHGGTYAGTHVNWILNVAAGASVTVSFDVRVNDTEAIVANTAVVRDGVNTYTTNEVVNHTVENELEKDVFAPADDSVSIDGKKVYEGDELLYVIRFTNTTGDVINLTITDSIPIHTTYVEDSADNGGICENGALRWEIPDVPAWGTVTVSFRVTVNTGIGAVTIENQAAATDGTNNYATEVVSNYTVEDEVGKEVFSADAPQISIDGKKVYNGDTLIYAITYKNTGAEKVTVTITDRIPEHTAYVAGSASHGGSFADGAVSWIVDVEAGESITVSFRVTVEAAESVTIRNQAQIQEGKNTYTTNEVSNYTVEDEVGKEVFSADAPQISIDGKKVYNGDTLIYAITYKNTGAEKVTVTITDRIPEHTAYVDGSASHGGSFADGAVSWIVDVEAGESITVSFRVTVEAAESVTIRNQAQIQEGKNTYTTNEVSNYTVEDEVEKQVFNAEAPVVNIDGQVVSFGDILIYTIRYRNTATEMAAVTIMDTVPQYTVYVDGSADNGGIYQDGKLVWNLEVPAGEEVVVSFMVKVSNESNALITNEATVVEGKNTYITNEVINSTEEGPPQTGDPTGLASRFAMMFISAGAVITLCVCELKNKKRENEA